VNPLPMRLPYEPFYSTKQAREGDQARTVHHPWAHPRPRRLDRGTILGWTAATCTASSIATAKAV